METRPPYSKSARLENDNDHNHSAVPLDEVLACSTSELPGRTSRKRLKIDGRDILIIKYGVNYYAMDSVCYHAGGPLYDGDIEELGGRLCLVCPWHKYKVCVDTGQNYYQSVDPFHPKTSVKWTAGSQRQRTHAVRVHEGNIYLKLTDRDGTLDSDKYNTEKQDNL
ncbi:Rieske domain-containing protein-like [Dreissena polymorpha]|uniref:Rieske domain-containing protein n=1 Tax=Dreissena polymorpha TaxID=45954 RepID=A0A9D3Y744_DREPO|nr:Rieske domain-containing protein-like [Dreissena polymorpha]KAH3695073.1 hypothetical protein DPMN_082524 [Dreissena polymorpha]